MSKHEAIFLKVIFTCDGFDEPVFFSVFTDSPLSEIIAEARQRFRGTFSPDFQHVADTYEFKSLSLA